MRTASAGPAASSLVLLLLGTPLQSQIPEELPDDYLVYELVRQGNEFRGEAEHFEGFVIALTISEQTMDDLDILEVLELAAERVAGQLAAGP